MFDRYHKQGAAIVREYCQQLRGECTLSAVLLQLVKFMIEVLRILPPLSGSNSTNSKNSSSTGNFSDQSTATASASAPAATSMQLLAKQSTWLLLNDERCPQVKL